MRSAVVWLLAAAILPLAASAEERLLSAARDGQLEVVRTLLEEGADVNAARGDGLTALHLAAEGGHRAVAEALVAAGAAVDAGTRIGGYTSLHVAARAGHGAVVLSLLEAGADPNARTGIPRVGKTPLTQAIKSNAHPQVIDTLIKAGGNPKKRDWSPVLNPMTLSMVVPAIVVFIVN